MKNYAMFNFNYLFGDHFAKASPKAKLLYINLSFYADCGFVPNPKQVCKSMGFDESVLKELIDIEELLTIEGRSEMFITSYFVHNTNFKPLSWLSTTYGSYWKNKMWMKKNRVATLKKDHAEEKPEEPIDITQPNSATEIDMDSMLEELEEEKKKKRQKRDKSVTVTVPQVSHEANDNFDINDDNALF